MPSVEARVYYQVQALVGEMLVRPTQTVSVGSHGTLGCQYWMMVDLTDQLNCQCITHKYNSLKSYYYTRTCLHDTASCCKHTVQKLQ